ncbi:MAG: prephenate dehydratase [Pseudomonadota bacterium]
MTETSGTGEGASVASSGVPGFDASRTGRISYQGEAGANSHVACQHVFPNMVPVPCATFEDALQATQSGDADYAMIPLENTLAGRVADVHLLLPAATLYIIGEYFLPIQYDLMAPHGATRAGIKNVYSHVHALGQCRRIIRELGARAHVSSDTAGAAREVSEAGDVHSAALAPPLAADHYDLTVLDRAVADDVRNTTRFVILGSQPEDADADAGDCVTTFIFRVRNVPAALYKGLGGFATNGVNMTKLESYQIDGAFTATVFYADIEGHPDDRNVRLALEELSFFSSEVRILGTYLASPYRAAARQRAAELATGIA